ncbi:MAG TPA: FtsX-like permease family protein [Acidimicrobiales bacterium]|nr:FtsX-like permease family protein [Acidimicrobiales bacterium]
MGLLFWVRWSWRDLRRRATQVFAIAAILGLGSAIYSGLTSTSSWRRASLDASLEALAIHDIRVEVLGDLVTTAEPLVSTITASVGPAATDIESRLIVRSPVTATAPPGELIPAAGEVVGVDLSSPPAVDRWTVVTGRDLQASDTGSAVALLDLHFARAHDLPDTGTLDVGGQTVEYVGLALSPDYLNLTTTSGEVVQGQSSRAVLYTSLPFARELRGTTDGLNDVVLRVREGTDVDAVASTLAHDLGTQVAGVPLDVTTRSADRSLVAMYDEIDSEQRVFEVFALLVLGGAAFAAFGLIKRVVEAQRRDIGIAMSLGLARPRIALRTLLFALEVTFLGVVLGVVAGLAISHWVLAIIQSRLPLPVWETPFQLGAFARAGIATLTVPLVASAIPIVRAVRAKPVDAFLPPNLREGKHGLSGLTRRLRLPGTMLLQAPLRRILRSPMRSVVTILAVAFVMAPLLAALGASDSAEATMQAGDRIVAGTGSDRLLVSLLGYQPEASEVIQQISAMPGVDHVALGLDTGGYIEAKGQELGISVSMVDLSDPLAAPPAVAMAHPASGGLVISRKAADDAGVGVGDEVTFRHPRREGTSFVWVDSRLPIRAIHNSPYRFVAYMDLADRDLFGLEGFVSSLKVTPAPGTSALDLQQSVAALPGIASALPTSAVAQTTRDLLTTLRRLFLILEAVIAALAFLVAYNATHVAIDERRRENATMFAFGIRVRRVLAMEVGESLTLGALGVLVGLGLGMAMLGWILDTVFPAASPDLAVLGTIAPASFVITVVIALAATAAAPLFTVRTLRRIDLPSTLRYVE